jgi:Fe-S-cluster containining protein
MEVQGRVEQTQLAVETSALVDLLVAKGVISAREFTERVQMAAPVQAKREEGLAFPMLGEMIDKYQIETPDIPCAELLPICRAACCNLTFSLTLQDLDEGVVRWNYALPYRVRQLPESGKCIHFVTGKGCSIYERRPAVCRSYDCRQDKRIWKDYENRIPSDTLANLAPVPAVLSDD